MNFKKRLVRSRVMDRLRPAVITGIVLCLANYLMDIFMDWIGTSASKTILNDVAIGILGSLAVFFYLSASHEKNNFESAKQRIVLIGELNLRIRDAIELFATSAISDDPFARLEGIDEATGRIDRILSDFMTEQKTGVAPGSVWPGRNGSARGPDSPADS